MRVIWVILPTQRTHLFMPVCNTESDVNIAAVSVHSLQST